MSTHRKGNDMEPVCTTGEIFKQFYIDDVYWEYKYWQNVSIYISETLKVRVYDGSFDYERISDNADVMIEAGDVCIEEDGTIGKFKNIMSLGEFFNQWLNLEEK